MALPFIQWFQNYRVRQADLHKSRMPVNWPKTQGKILYIGVHLVTDDDIRLQGYDACFTYTFSLTLNGELEYFSGEFKRAFEDEEPAKSWLAFLKDKNVPVRYKSGNPEISAILDEDLDAVEIEFGF